MELNKLINLYKAVEGKEPRMLIFNDGKRTCCYFGDELKDYDIKLERKRGECMSVETKHYLPKCYIGYGEEDD